MNRSHAPCLILLACTLALSCKDKEADSSKGKSQPVLNTATAPSITPDAEIPRSWHGDYMLKGASLMRILDDGESETVLAHPGASYCETDTRSQAVWLLSDAGLSVYDLETQKLELVVAATPKAIEAFEVRFGLDQGKVGNADGLLHDVALIVVAAKRIELRTEIICEGEREALCYVDTSTDDPDLWELRPAAAALQKRYDALKLSDTPLLQTLAERRLARSDDELETDEEAVREGSEEAEGGMAEGGVVETKREVVDGKILCGTIGPPAATAPSALTQ